MAKTQDIKRRIRSIGNTRQLTRAMKMVSAAKLRRAQEKIVRARPYARRTLEVLRSLARRAEQDANPLLKVRGDRRVELVVVTADKGLCGAFNTAIIREAEQFVRNDLTGRELHVTTVGKKGRDYFARRDYDVRQEWIDVFRVVEFETAERIADTLMDLYVAEQVDEIYLVYNEFKSAIQARPVVQRLLPVEPIEADPGDTEDYIYEPSAQELFAKLLPHYVEVLVFHALLESSAAEHAARMTAMDNATNNAGELIESLTLTMNRVRQASITTEIIEVVSGAEALG
jgi:F-type H+-transporting ATPase subunit gamma